MEIKIGKTARHCVACDHEFVHEEPLHSRVRLEDQVLAREDFCRTCWDSSRAHPAFSVWQSKYYDPRIAEQEPPEVFSPLRQAFYESVEAQDRPELAKAYLAAHLLRRQKVFRMIKESDGTDDDIRIALFADRIGNRLIEVRDPNLSHDELEAGRVVLLERLKQLENPYDSDEPPCAQQPEAAGVASAPAAHDDPVGD
jgi:hypothetical protein